ncbi:hypothetical protein G6F22_019670 [Rhizopus arrhizus]|nr:hypothetical protein G6F22_019670 [Rhizopus arrhizus]KAG0922864.1 hypothetical protein G6F31_019741 [Rhizopus arrhizus]KAG1077582.1 hypothetical protein G6F40_017035 [Rhizopus arrhizus]
MACAAGWQSRLHGAGSSGWWAACSWRSRWPCCVSARADSRRARGLPRGERFDMIKWAIIFAIIGVIAGVLGFGGIAGAAVGIAKFLFWAGIIIAVVLFLLGMTVARKVS